MKHNKISNFLDWILSIVCYALVLLIATLVFKKTIIIDNSLYGIWFLISSLVIYLLNKLIKPILVFITLPITGITMGLFYPFINVIILYINDFIMGSHFEIKGILMALVVAIFISIVRKIIEGILKPLTGKDR